MNFYLSIFLLLFVGCSSKEYYKPKQEIFSYNKQISHQKIDHNIPDYISKSKYEIVSFATQGTLQAIIYANNSIKVFDQSDQSIKLTIKESTSIVNNEIMAKPIFTNDLILFPMLNGKIVVVDKRRFKKIRSLNLDPSNNINNIIYLKQTNNTIIAATNNKIMSLGNTKFNILSYNIKDLLVHNNFIYLATLEGEIIKLDISLKVIAKHKFRFAQLHSLHYDRLLRVIDYDHYIIELDENLENITIYDYL